MLFHHVLSIFGQALVVFRGRNGTEMMAVLFGSEISNPSLQLRWFLRESNRKGTLVAEINDHVFVLTFGFWRLVVGTILLHCTWTHPRPDAISKLGGLTIYLLGWVFWFSIMQFVVKKYKKYYRYWASTRKPRINGSSSANGHVSGNGSFSSTVQNVSTNGYLKKDQ